LVQLYCHIYPQEALVYIVATPKKIEFGETHFFGATDLSIFHFHGIKGQSLLPMQRIGIFTKQKGPFKTAITELSIVFGVTKTRLCMLRPLIRIDWTRGEVREVCAGGDLAAGSWEMGPPNSGSMLGKVMYIYV